MQIELLGGWFFFAMLAPVVWAMATILDVWLVGSGVYSRAIDGAIISASFSSLPLLAMLPSIQVANIAAYPAIISFIAGVFFYFHTLYFLKALFALNDAASADSIDTLSVVVVPVLAFLLLGDVLVIQHYLAILCSAMGCFIIACGYLNKTSGNALVFSLLSVLFVSMATVSQAFALSKNSYETSVAIFSVSVLLCGLVSAICYHSFRKRIGVIIRRFGLLFISAECLQQGAMLSSQRATQLAPSVSVVKVAECTSPLFVLLFSAAAIRLVGRRTCTPDINALQYALGQQLSNLPLKLTAVLFISLGVCLVYLAPT